MEGDHVLLEEETKPVAFEVVWVVKICENFDWMAEGVGYCYLTVNADFFVNISGKSEVHTVLEDPIVRADFSF
jgi:hypothetical protein